MEDNTQGIPAPPDGSGVVAVAQPQSQTQPSLSNTPGQIPPAPDGTEAVPVAQPTQAANPQQAPQEDKGFLNTDDTSVNPVTRFAKGAARTVTGMASGAYSSIADPGKDENERRMLMDPYLNPFQHEGGSAFSRLSVAAKRMGIDPAVEAWKDMHNRAATAIGHIQDLQTTGKITEDHAKELISNVKKYEAAGKVVASIPFVGPWTLGVADHINKTGDVAGGLGELAGGELAGELITKGKGVAKGMKEGLTEGVKSAVTPEIKTTSSGAEIPVRNTSKVGQLAAQAVDENIPKRMAAEQTAPAVAKAVGDVAGEASGSGVETAPSTGDRFGLRGHAADVEMKAKPVYAHLDELSDGEFSQAQTDMDNARNDFSVEGREKFKDAQARKQSIIDGFRDDLKEAGMDPDEADASYRKAKALEKVANKLDQATGPSDFDRDYAVSGKKLAKAVDDMVKKGDKGLLQRAGFTEEHIAQVQELANILKDEEQVPKFNKFASGAAKILITLFGLKTGGIAGAAEALAGESLAEKVGKKVVNRAFGNAMLDPAVAKDLVESTKKGDSQGFVNKIKSAPWFSKLKDYAKALWTNEAGSAAAPGRVGLLPGEQEAGISSIDEGLKQLNAKKVSPPETEYRHPTDGVHEVTSKVDGETRGYTMAKDTEAPGVAQVKANWTMSELQGKGTATARLENLVKKLAEDPKMETLLSDSDMTESAHGPWQKLKAKYPEAVTEHQTSNGTRYSFDLNKLREPEPEAKPIPQVAGTAEGAARDTALFQQARQELGPNASFSQIATRAQELKTAGANTTENEIGTTRPWAQSAGDEHSPNNVIGMDSVRAAAENSKTKMSPNGTPKLGYADKLAAAISKYRGFKLDPADYGNSPRIINKFVDHLAKNIDFLYKQIPDAIKEPSAKWYASANRAIVNKWAGEYGYKPRQVAAVVAALSPQNPWENNIGTARVILDAVRDHQNHEWSDAMESRGMDLSKGDPEMRSVFKNIRGKTLGEIKEPVEKALWIRLMDETESDGTNHIYSPDGNIVGADDRARAWPGLSTIAKALNVLEDGSMDNIHKNLGYGHKVRNFYNNLVNPSSKNGHVTIDTHAVSAANLLPLGGNDPEVSHNFGSSSKGTPGVPSSAMAGVSGSYPLYAEAYRRVANKLGIPVHELQSVTWEGIRSLFGNKKGPEVGMVKGVWQDYKDGKISLDEARNKTIEYSGGFKKPNWMSDAAWEKSKEDSGDTSLDFGGEK